MYFFHEVQSAGSNAAFTLSNKLTLLSIFDIRSTIMVSATTSTSKGLSELLTRNHDVREAIKKAGIRQWMVAEKYGLSEEHFCRILRYELSPAQKTKIFDAIEELKLECGRTER